MLIEMKQYEKPQMEIVAFETIDKIASSTGTGDWGTDSGFIPGDRPGGD